MAKAKAATATNDGTVTEKVEGPNVPKKHHGSTVAPGPANKPAGKTTTNRVADGSTVSAGGTGKNPAAETKTSLVLKKLNAAKGATIEAMMEATGWQAHSVRGFLSAVVRKKLGHNLISETGKDGVRRYRIQADGKAG